MSLGGGIPENEMEPRLAQAQAGKQAVFFVDVGHFVLAPFPGFLMHIITTVLW